MTGIGTHITPMLTRWIAFDKDSPYDMTVKDNAIKSDSFGDKPTSKKELKAHSQPITGLELQKQGFDIGGHQVRQSWRKFWTFDTINLGDLILFDNREYEIMHSERWATHTEFNAVATK